MLETPADESPQELYIRLMDIFRKWVNSEKEDIMETLVLEQYRVLYPDVRTWVKEWVPATVAVAAKLVDVDAAHKGPEAYQYSDQLQTSRGKCEGSGKSDGSTGPTHSQPKILKLTAEKKTLW